MRRVTGWGFLVVPFFFFPFIRDVAPDQSEVATKTGAALDFERTF